MTEYLLSITGVVILSTVLSNILPTGKTTNLIKGFFRLCAHIVILSPVADFINDYSTKKEEIFKNYFEESVIKTDENYIEYCSEKTVAETERQIEKTLKEDYSISALVKVILAENGDDFFQIEKIVVEVENISTETKSKIEQDFKTQFSVDIEFT